MCVCRVNYPTRNLIGTRPFEKPHIATRTLLPLSKIGLCIGLTLVGVAVKGAGCLISRRFPLVLN